jgi:hypothetical protein
LFLELSKLQHSPVKSPQFRESSKRATWRRRRTRMPWTHIQQYLCCSPIEGIHTKQRRWHHNNHSHEELDARNDDIDKLGYNVDMQTQNRCCIFCVILLCLPNNSPPYCSVF